MSDTVAMLDRAFSLDERGARDEAFSLIDRAADAGDADALAERGLWLIIGRHGEKNPARGIESLRLAASQKNLPAMLLLATLSARGDLTGKPDYIGAVRWLTKAAKRGSPPALRQLGMLLKPHPQHDRLRHSLLLEAARGGDGTARAMLARQRFAPVDGATTLGKVPWMTIERFLAFPHDAPLPAPRSLGDRLSLKVAEDVIDVDLCFYLMALGSRFLAPALVNDAAKGSTADGTRTNSAMSFHLMEADVVTTSIELRLTKLMDLEDPLGSEPMSLLRYRPGEAYAPHFDFYDPDFPAHAAYLRQGRQRAQTALLYLNDQYTGGETAFPKIDLCHRGKIGSVLLFRNVHEDGAPNRDTLHAGLPPTNGEKYVLSKRG